MIFRRNTAAELAEREEDRAVEEDDLGLPDWDFVPADTRRWAFRKAREARTLDAHPYDDSYDDEYDEAIRRARSQLLALVAYTKEVAR